MKSFIWKQYTVQITKKNVKNTNVRIKRDNPHVILMSIPYSATYKAGLLALETPHIRHWLDNYERKLKQQPVPTDEEKFRNSSAAIYEIMPQVLEAGSLDSLRGLEGAAASVDFDVIDDMILRNKDSFFFLRNKYEIF